MSKRKDLKAAWGSGLLLSGLDIHSLLWELGRIAGIREATRMARIWHTDMEDSWRAIVVQRDSTVADLRAHARKLARRLKL